MKPRWMLPALLGLGSLGLVARPADAAGWLASANRLYAARDFGGALADYSRALTGRDSARAYEGVGDCLVAEGQGAQALKYYQWSLRLDPDNAALRSGVAGLEARLGVAQPTLAGADRLYHEGHYGRALAAYQELTRLHPHDAWAFQGMGNAYYAQGRQKEAMAQYRKALALDPQNAALAGFVAAHD